VALLVKRAAVEEALLRRTGELAGSNTKLERNWPAAEGERSYERKI